MASDDNNDVNQDEEVERQQETSKAANKALEAQKKAKELTEAAAGTGDADERQKLLNEALNKEVEAESFGKTAKYLQSGAFQGLLAGTGLGGGVGVWLGVVTGTLVGGTTGILTGGLGGAIGSGVGAIHGAWFKVGDWMGDGIRKITGDIPGWKATEEQKGALENMVNGVKEQERPAEDELMQMSEGKIAPGKGYTGQREQDEGEKDGMLHGQGPSAPSVPLPWIGSKQSKTQEESKSKVENGEQDKTQPNVGENYAGFTGEAVTASLNQSDNQDTNGGSTEGTATGNNAPNQSYRPRAAPCRSSRRVQQQSQTTAVETQQSTEDTEDVDVQASKPRKKPRKLEVRSDQ